jgi:hypothetical protein
VTLNAAATTALAASLAALCCAGGGSPEETLETFNGLMAAKDFEGAAAVVCVRDMEGAPAADLDARRAAYAGYLAEQYDDEDLDYGRAEIKERKKTGPDDVELTVVYPLRSKAAAPRAARTVAATRIGGRWYLVLAHR